MNKQKSEKKSKTIKTPKEISEKKYDKKTQEIISTYAKKIFDLTSMFDIAKSLCQNLDLYNLLQSIVYTTMSQVLVSGVKIFVRNLLEDNIFTLEDGKVANNEEKVVITIDDNVASKILQLNSAMTIEQFTACVPDNSELIPIITNFSPTLIAPLIQQGHLYGLLILQERIVFDANQGYTEDEKKRIMDIASLAAVAINNAVLLEKSSTEPMTHLRQKYYFFNTLTHTIDTSIPVAEDISIIMFDIDFFKKFNDTYGHDCGDMVLIKVAELIKDSIRDNDVACRYGGEEFTIMLTNCGKEQAMLIAEKIRSTIDNYKFVYNSEDPKTGKTVTYNLHVTISGGVSVFQPVKDKKISAHLLVKQADQALYTSKENGRNQITFFEPSEPVQTSEKSSEENSPKA